MTPEEKELEEARFWKALEGEVADDLARRGLLFFHGKLSDHAKRVAKIILEERRRWGAQ